MLVEDAGLVMLKNVEIWGAEEVECVKEAFETARPVVPKRLASTLFRYWCAREPAGLLFAEELQKVALYLHARAYGEDVTQMKRNRALQNLLTASQAEYSALMPEPLTWGPRAILSDNAPVALNSVILQAFVFMDNDVPRRVLVLGEGLANIYLGVFQAVCGTSLQIRAGSWDFLNPGVLNVQLTGDLAPLQLPFAVMGDSPVALSPKETKTAEAIMSKLVGALKELERNTALIRVHEVNQEAVLELQGKWRDLAAGMADGGVKLWAPGAGAEKPAAIAEILPLFCMTADGQSEPLRFELSEDLLGSGTFGKLFDVFQRVGFERLLADVANRVDSYMKTVKDLETRKREFDAESDPQRREALFGKTVTLTVSFDHETGREIRLAEPHEVLMEVHYRENVPQLIEGYRQWHQRMKAYEDALVATYQGPDAPGRRFTISHFMDAAIRSRPERGGEALSAAFKAWKQEVQPMAWFELRQALQKRGLPPEAIVNRHTFFHTFCPDVTGDGKPESLKIMPFTLFDNRHSVAIADSSLGVLTAKDGTDYAEPTQTGSAAAAAEGWARLKEVAGQEGVTTAQITTELKRQISQSPHEFLKLVAGHLFARDAAVEGTVDLDAACDGIRTHANHALRAAYRALGVGALQTAGRTLDELVNHPDRMKGVEWRVFLMRALVHCLAKRLPAVETVLEAFEQGSAGDSEVSDCVAKAGSFEASKDDVSEWMKHVRKWEDKKENDGQSRGLGKGLVALFQGLKPADKLFSKEERAALLARGAAEDTRIARELRKTLEQLPDSSLPYDEFFAIIGRELEGAIVTKYGSGDGDAYDLLELATGEEHLKYRRLGR